MPLSALKDRELRRSNCLHRTGHEELFLDRGTLLDFQYRSVVVPNLHALRNALNAIRTPRQQAGIIDE